MSDTPITDALPNHTQQIYYPGCKGVPRIQRWVPIEGAMELESVLAKAQAECTALRTDRDNLRRQLAMTERKTDTLLAARMTDEKAIIRLGKARFQAYTNGQVLVVDAVTPDQLEAIAWLTRNKTESNLDQGHQPGT